MEGVRNISFLLLLVKLQMNRWNLSGYAINFVDLILRLDFSIF